MTEVRYSAAAQARSPEVAAMNRAYTAGALVERILRNHRDVDLESLRLAEDGDVVTVVGQIPESHRKPEKRWSPLDPEPYDPPQPPEPVIKLGHRPRESE